MAVVKEILDFIDPVKIVPNVVNIVSVNLNPRYLYIQSRLSPKATSLNESGD